MKVCGACGRPFPRRLVIDGRLRFLYRRRFCFSCSPFGSRNTSKTPPGIVDPEELREFRRRRKNAQTYETLKRRRKDRKERLVAMRGGACEDCGYNTAPRALEFHHRDARAKEFAVSSWQGSFEQLVLEAEKCDVLCANCHRTRHAALDRRPGGPVVESRRRSKQRAIAYMGGRCEGCACDGEPAIFEFHHRNGSEKAFGITQDGIPRSWPNILAELSKCVMLCANCHREVHAGYRDLEMLHGLAEEPAEYVA